MISHNASVVLQARVPFLPTSSAPPRRKSGLSGEVYPHKETLNHGATHKSPVSRDHRNVECVTKLLHMKRNLWAVEI